MRLPSITNTTTFSSTFPFQYLHAYYHFADWISLMIYFNSWFSAIRWLRSSSNRLIFFISLSIILHPSLHLCYLLLLLTLTIEISIGAESNITGFHFPSPHSLLIHTDHHGIWSQILHLSVRSMKRLLTWCCGLRGQVEEVPGYAWTVWLLMPCLTSKC